MGDKVAAVAATGYSSGGNSAGDQMSRESGAGAVPPYLDAKPKDFASKYGGTAPAPSAGGALLKLPRAP